VSNFAEIYAALDAAHGAEQADNAGRLTGIIGALLAQPQEVARIAAAARATVESQSGALERTLQSLEPYLMHLQFAGRTDHA
jgi:3-deoxy-D-manno-octulosonic-acid transferase